MPSACPRAEAEAFRKILVTHPTSAEVAAAARGARAAQLANQSAHERSWDELLGGSEPDPQLADRMLQLLGEEGPAPARQMEPRPDVSGVRRALGI